MRSFGAWKVGFDTLMSAVAPPLTRDSAFLRSFGWTMDLDRASAIENGGLMFIWSSPYSPIRYTTSTAFMIEEMVHPDEVRKHVRS
jgi:hypothetical protein